MSEVSGESDVIKQYLSAIGSRGGSAAKGDKKRRPRAHYQRMAKLSHLKRKAKKKAAKDAANE